jgi:signal transduction histidine kinase
MLDPRTLRGRLTITYAIALVIALVAFGTISFFFVDRSERESRDAELRTSALALQAIVDVRHGRIMFDVDDRKQFDRIVGLRYNGALFLADGAIVDASVSAVPSGVRDFALHKATDLGLADVAVGDTMLRVAVVPVPANGAAGYIAVWRDSRGLAALDRRALFALAATIPLVLVLGVAAGGAIADRGLRPLARIAELAAEIEGTELSLRLDLPPRDDELGRLAATFDRMLARLEEAFERERRFTSDASHELRAPLTVIRAEADLALRRDRSTTEYRRALEAVVREADALEALTRDLLALARAEAGAMQRGDPVDLAEVAGGVTERLEVLARAREIRLERHLAGAALVAANSSELSVVALSLVHNAIKYASDRGHVDVTVAREDGRIILRVSDDGPGFSPSGLEHAFERFWRDDRARGRDGTGLGLAIAQRIVQSSGGSIVARNRASGGAELIVSFPEFT